MKNLPPPIEPEMLFAREKNMIYMDESKGFFDVIEEEYASSVMKDMYDKMEKNCIESLASNSNIVGKEREKLISEIQNIKYAISFESVLLNRKRYSMYMYPITIFLEYPAEKVSKNGANNSNERFFSVLTSSIRHNAVMGEIKDFCYNVELFKKLENDVNTEYANLHLLRDVLHSITAHGWGLSDVRTILFTHVNKNKVDIHKPFDSLAGFLFPNELPLTEKEYQGEKVIRENSPYMLLQQCLLAKQAVDYKLKKITGNKGVPKYLKTVVKKQNSVIRPASIPIDTSIDYKHAMLKFADNLLTLLNTRPWEENYKSVLEQTFDSYRKCLSFDKEKALDFEEDKKKRKVLKVYTVM